MNWLDIYLPQQPTDEMVTKSFASAFGVARDDVQIAQENSDESRSAWEHPRIRIIVTRERLERDGDFPFGLTLLFKNKGIQEPHLLDGAKHISQELDMPLLTNVSIPDFPDDLWRLVSPDGWTEVVELDDEALNEGRMVLAPAAHRLLRDHLNHAQTATLRRAG